MRIFRSPLLAVTADEWLATDSNSKLILQNLGPYCIFVATTNTLTTDKDEIRTAAPSGRASITAKAKEDASVMSSNGLLHAIYSETLPRQYYGTDLPMDIVEGPWWTSLGTFRMMECELEHISNYKNCASKSSNIDQACTINHVIHHVGQGVSTRYVLEWYEYTASNATINRNATLPLYIIACYWRKTRIQTAWSGNHDIRARQELHVRQR